MNKVGFCVGQKRSGPPTLFCKKNGTLNGGILENGGILGISEIPKLKTYFLISPGYEKHKQIRLNQHMKNNLLFDEYV